jgi:hypothetical protein
VKYDLQDYCRLITVAGTCNRTASSPAAGYRKPFGWADADYPRKHESLCQLSAAGSGAYLGGVNAIGCPSIA